MRAFRGKRSQSTICASSSEFFFYILATYVFGKVGNLETKRKSFFWSMKAASRSCRSEMGTQTTRNIFGEKDIESNRRRRQPQTKSSRQADSQIQSKSNSSTRHQVSWLNNCREWWGFEIHADRPIILKGVFCESGRLGRNGILSPNPSIETKMGTKDDNNVDGTGDSQSLRRIIVFGNTQKNPFVNISTPH